MIWNSFKITKYYLNFRVRLLVHKRTEEKIACKIIDHSKYKDAKSNIRREVLIHRLCNHENVIKFFGRREEPQKEYIFLEYAAGGELFQMIGMHYLPYRETSLNWLKFKNPTLVCLQETLNVLWNIYLVEWDTFTNWALFTEILSLKIC